METWRSLESFVSNLHHLLLKLLAMKEKFFTKHFTVQLKLGYWDMFHKGLRIFFNLVKFAFKVLLHRVHHVTMPHGRLAGMVGILDIFGLITSKYFFSKKIIKLTFLNKIDQILLLNFASTTNKKSKFSVFSLILRHLVLLFYHFSFILFCLNIS